MGELAVHHALSHRQPRLARPASPNRNRDEAANAARRILQLQRQAGNHAVVNLLQRDTGSHRENPSVTDLHPAGTMDDAAWTSAYLAAVAAGTADAFRPLFRDIAVTARMGALPGFDLSSIPTTDGKTAQPGLNISMSTSDEPGHTGTWKQADPAVRQEALTRLREYHATLDADHQRLWKEWLDKQLAAAAAKDTTGRRDFLTELSAFVK